MPFMSHSRPSSSKPVALSAVLMQRIGWACRGFWVGLVGLAVFALLVGPCWVAIHQPQRLIRSHTARVQNTRQDSARPPQDPNWDGALSGICIGYTVGRHVPFFGMPIMVFWGALLGYQLDEKL